MQWDKFAGVCIAFSAKPRHLLMESSTKKLDVASIWFCVFPMFGISEIWMCDCNERTIDGGSSEITKLKNALTNVWNLISLNTL